MKKSFITFSLIVFICISSNAQLKGSFLKIKETEEGMGLVSELEFVGTYCKFVYFDMQMNGKFEEVENNIFITVGGELGILSLKIVNQNTLEGEGWISGIFKRKTFFVAKNESPIKFQYAVSNVNMRAGAGVDFVKFDVIPQNTKLKVVESVNDWCRVEYDGLSGYVNDEYLSDEPQLETDKKQYGLSEINSRTQNAFANSGSGSDGTGRGGGNQGTGAGISFDLGGRSAISLPKPDYPGNDAGIVVVKVIVDKNGKVTSAEPGARGTTIANKAFWDEAKQAALKAKFNIDQDAPAFQQGTISYRFRLD
ncbi:SH3 domain-containing protein [uncultured Draconibacterium sp.]|uniref:SH3 domain-containing protein n=1 Tax=uncultured Draconibacterium sp. TaxID=1573823 RepID=UPI0029C77A70|nr:SH3 domain-containing protein [uncultured Draconibacterium sp.]